jgi:ADP-heptose:LPS heptosyltransferase
MNDVKGSEIVYNDCQRSNILQMNRDRILIFRPDNIGDVILFSGALRPIRELYPTAHLTLAVQEHIVNLMELCPYIDTCIPVGKLTWWDRFKSSKIPSPKIFRKAVRSLNRKWNQFHGSFNKIIFPVKSPQPHHLDIIYCLNVRDVIGITGCNINVMLDGCHSDIKSEALFSDHFDLTAYDPWRHELLTTFDYLIFLGSRVSIIDEIQPQLWLSDLEKDHLADARKGGKTIIGIFPGASFKAKCWDPKNYCELAKQFAKEPLYAIFGGEAEKDLAYRVERSIREAGKDIGIIDLAGKMTLREMAKSISSCDIFISMDSSGLHMAIATGVPTIGVIGGGHYGRFVPWGDPKKNIFLTRKMECFHCNWNCRRQRVDCIQGITPLEVAEAMRRLLAISNGQVEFKHSNN